MANGKIAVLVDAGYFCAQATEVVFGQTKRRDEIKVNEALLVEAMEEMAKMAFPDREVLRVYWYDAPPQRGVLSPSQEALGMMAGVKLRMGKLNGSGQQKQVDALLCRDIEDLARNRAVDSILLVSGDEDLMLAMELAQSFGTQVKLLGIGTGGNASIGSDMAMASDGVRRMGKETAALLVSLGSGEPAPKKRPSRAKEKKEKVPAAKPAREAAPEHAHGDGAHREHARPAEEGQPAQAFADHAAPAAPVHQAARAPQQGQQHGQQRPAGEGKSKKRRNRNKNRRDRERAGFDASQPHQQGQGQRPQPQRAAESGSLPHAQEHKEPEHAGQGVMVALAEAPEAIVRQKQPRSPEQAGEAANPASEAAAELALGREHAQRQPAEAAGEPAKKPARKAPAKKAEQGAEPAAKPARKAPAKKAAAEGAEPAAKKPARKAAAKKAQQAPSE